MSATVTLGNTGISMPNLLQFHVTPGDDVITDFSFAGGDLTQLPVGTTNAVTSLGPTRCSSSIPVAH